MKKELYFLRWLMRNFDKNKTHYDAFKVGYDLGVRHQKLRVKNSLRNKLDEVKRKYGKSNS
jgi:hypothetical protein